MSDPTLRFKLNVSNNLAGVLLKIRERLDTELTHPLGLQLIQTLQTHFRARENQPNKKGWKKSNWWKREAINATELAHFDKTSATVEVQSLQFAHRYRGGVIRPKNAKMLAIPMREEAYRAGSPNGGKGKKQAGQIPGLRLMINHSTRKAFLVKDERKSFKGASAATKWRHARTAAKEGEKRPRLTIYYLLVRSVVQRPDPAAMPPDHVVAADVTNKGQELLAALARRRRL